MFFNVFRHLCRQEEEVLLEFDKVKLLLDQQKALDEDEYQRTKIECLVLGGKLTDIHRFAFSPFFHHFLPKCF
jgi:hypothetical protein